MQPGSCRNYQNYEPMDELERGCRFPGSAPEQGETRTTRGLATRAQTRAIPPLGSSLLTDGRVRNEDATLVNGIDRGAKVCIHSGFENVSGGARVKCRANK